MGVFYHIRSVALIEDLPGEETHFASIDDFYQTVERGYTLVSTYLNIIHEGFTLVIIII